MRSGERGDFGQSHGRTTRLSLSLSLTWYTHREKNLALVKSGLYRSLGPRYMFGSCHAWNCSLEDIGGLSSFWKVPTRVEMQYARYPAVRRGVEGQQAGRARGDEEKANDFRAGETETRRQRTRHENEVQGDCAFPVLHNHFIGAGHLGRPIAILLGLGSSVSRSLRQRQLLEVEWTLHCLKCLLLFLLVSGEVAVGRSFVQFCWGRAPVILQTYYRRVFYAGALRVRFELTFPHQLFPEKLDRFNSVKIGIFRTIQF